MEAACSADTIVLPMNSNDYRWGEEGGTVVAVNSAVAPY